MIRRRFIQMCAGGLLLDRANLQAAETHLVLVAAVNSSFSNIAANDVRKAYLGVSVLVNDKAIVPIINSSNPDTKELFLQRVLFMSSAVFERHSIGRIFRNGGNKMSDFSDVVALANALSANPLSISFMQANDARKLSSVRVLAEL
jgi:hypothetical protein